eukprot:gnl/Chilomastix_cuspidata/1560.p1 GENE.gnl/Chilomastix_cuspidata/1560~~gnl/Chilomastix_cuspidata/1560.p1  ORF type:complete len:217 (-),score=57.64 gnl/Chilomastix_cuspidata/1560:211-861(-)
MDADTAAIFGALEAKLISADASERREARARLEEILARLPPSSAASVRSRMSQRMPSRESPAEGSARSGGRRSEEEKFEKKRQEMFGTTQAPDRKALEDEYLRRKAEVEARKNFFGTIDEGQGYGEKNVLSGLGTAYRSPMYDPALREQYKRRLQDQIIDKQLAEKHERKERQRHELESARAIMTELAEERKREHLQDAEKKREFRRLLDEQTTSKK